jgi:Lar family restriction alleviation protein
MAQQTNPVDPMTTTRFCIDCKHFFRHPLRTQCRHPDSPRDVVTGLAESPFFMRRVGGPCEEYGHLFSPKKATADCPFCGHADHEVDEVSPGVLVIVCGACGAMGPFDPNVPQTAADATKAWNARGDHHAA